MDLGWFQSILFGLFSGLAEILPVSAPAHRTLLLKVFGVNSEVALFRMMLHLGTMVALYYSCHTQILRFIRARKLAAVPKRMRKRPLDTNSLMDLRLLTVACIPVVAGLFFYTRALKLQTNLLYLGGFLLLNGAILYIPQFLPGSNKRSDSVTGVDGFLMGIGGGLSVVPGLSGIGASTSIGLVCGLDRQYALNTSLLLQLPVMAGLTILDFVEVLSIGANGFGFGEFVAYFFAGVAAFAGTYLAVKVIRVFAENTGFAGFAYCNWGAALLSVILYITI